MVIRHDSDRIFAALLSWAAPFSRRSTARPISPPCRSASRRALRGALGGIGERLGVRKGDKLPAGLRAERRAPGHPRLDHQPCRRPRSRARAAVRARRRQSRAVGDGDFRQHSAVQSAKDAGGIRRAGDTDRGNARQPNRTRKFRSSPAISRRCCRAPRSCCGPIDEVLQRVREAANWPAARPGQLAGAGGIGAVAVQAGLRDRRQYGRSLRRLRGAHRAGEHHVAAEDREADHRRQ